MPAAEPERTTALKISRRHFRCGTSLRRFSPMNNPPPSSLPTSLPEAHEWRAAILESALDCIITMNAEGHVVEFNPAAERVFGHTLAEAQGREMAELIIPERYREGHRAGLARHLATGERRVMGRRIELEGLRADGTEFPLELTITRLGTSGAPLFTAFIRDLTDTRTAQNALRESEAKFKQLFEKSSDAILLLDPDLFVECNASAVEMMRCASKEELLKLHPSAISPPFQPDGRPSFEKANEMIGLALSTGSHRFEWTHRRADGEDFPTDILLTGIRLGNRQLLYAVLRDITEAKRTEAALRASETRLRGRTERVVRFQTALMELTKSDLSDLDAALRNVTETDARTLQSERVSVWFFNAAKSSIVCHDLYEATPDRHAAGTVLDAASFPCYFAALATQRTIAAQDAGRDPATSEFREAYLEPLGIVSMLDVPIWRNGRMIGVICHEHTGAAREWSTEEQDFAASVADVVALALEASERRSAETRFRTMFERSPDALVFFERETGTFNDCNEEALRLLRCTKAEIIGKHPWEIAPPFQPDGRPTKEAALALPALVERTGSARFEWQHGRGDGTDFPAEISVTSVEIEKRPMWLAVIRDVTARQEAEAEVARVQASLEQRVAARTAEFERANRAKSEFLSRMSHELRTPMNSILGFGQILARKVAEGDQRKYVQHILDAGRHLLELINEVLDISRIESDQLRLSTEPVALAAAAREAMNLVQHLASEREVAVRDDFHEPDVFVMADRQRLMQVLVNLLSNGVKYNRRTGSVTITCFPAGERAQISISDTGPGIAADKLDRLFSPFDRLGAEDSEIEGTGLGLALSKRLVEHMGGALRVSSKEGVGTDFWIELPLAKDPRAALRPRREAVVGDSLKTTDARRFTVLYIEDNAANLSLVETLFAEVPAIQLLVETRGVAGVARAVAVRPDLVLLDMHLPDLPGDQVLRQLKGDRLTATIPVIVVSADATASHIKAMLAAGALHYFTKPLDVDRFVAAVEATLRAEKT